MLEQPRGPSMNLDLNTIYQQSLGVDTVTRRLSPAEDLVDDAYFDEHATLVLQASGMEKAFQLSAYQLDVGAVLGRTTSRTSKYLNIQIDLTPFQGEALGVSRQHAYLCYDSDNQMVKVMDLDSSNGTKVNGQRLHPDEVRVLRHGDRLRLGKLEFVVMIQQASSNSHS